MESRRSVSVIEAAVIQMYSGCGSGVVRLWWWWWWWWWWSVEIKAKGGKYSSTQVPRYFGSK